MNNKKILIVEDDADVRLGYQVLLRAHGYDTIFAVNSSGVAGQVRQEEPDLVLLDLGLFVVPSLGLPVGDGFDVLEQLRALTGFAMIPVVVVSARDINSSRDRALNAGARAYLQKPWNDDDLLATISGLLGQPEPVIQPPVNVYVEQ